jgi:hypothetical protein
VLEPAERRGRVGVRHLGRVLHSAHLLVFPAPDPRADPPDPRYDLDVAIPIRLPVSASTTSTRAGASFGLRASVRRHRRAQGGSPMRRSIRPTRATAKQVFETGPRRRPIPLERGHRSGSSVAGRLCGRGDGSEGSLERFSQIM